MIGRLASLKTTYQKGTITNTLLYTATQLVTLSVSASNQVEDELTHSVSISRSPEQVDYFVDADNADDYKFTGGDIGDVPQYDPDITLIRGVKYTFKLLTGVDNYGQNTATGQGSETGTVSWITASGDSANTYYYNCEYHGPMNGQIIVQSGSGGNSYTINVTNNGSGAYTLSGNDRLGAVSGDNLNVTITEGDTINFVVNAPGHPFHINYANVTGTANHVGTGAGGAHPFRIQTGPAIGGGNTPYTNGVTGNDANGVPGNSLVTFDVPDDAPDTLYYQCTSHPAMTGKFNIVSTDAGHKDSDYLAYGIPMEVGGNALYEDITLKAGDRIFVTSSEPGVSFVAIASKSFPNVKLDVAKLLGSQNSYISSTAFPQINDNVGLVTATNDGVATIHVSNRNSDRSASVSVGIASGDISTFTLADYFLFGLRLKPLQDLTIDNIGLAKDQTLVTRASRTDVAFAAYTAPIDEGATGVGTDGDVNTTGVITATAFVGDGSQITGVTAAGFGVSISNNMSPIGVAATINFGEYLNVSPISAGIVTVSVPNIVGTALTAQSLAVGVAVTRADTAGVADYATLAGLATEAVVSQSTTGNAATASLALGVGTNFDIVSYNPIRTYDKFYGDGSMLTNITAVGSGIEVKDDGSVVGTASTIDFGLSIDVGALVNGSTTLSVQKVPHADICGVASYSDKCGVATFATNSGIASNALNANFAQTSSFSTLTGAAETSKSLYTEFQGNFKPLPVTIGGKTINHRYNGIGSDRTVNIQGYNSPYLRFEVGQTYRFENAAQQANYPIEFYYAASGDPVGFGTTSPSKMTQGVTVTGSYTEIEVTEETPQLFYYGAGVGSTGGSMGNSVQVFNHEFHKFVKVGEYKNLAGLKTCTHTQMFEGRATAWYMNTNLGVGNSDYTPGDRSHNVSSIEQVSTGVYTVNFADAMKDNNYAVVINGRGTNNFPGGLVRGTVYDRTTTGFGVTIYNGIPAVEDLQDVNIVVYGGQDGEPTYL